MTNDRNIQQKDFDELQNADILRNHISLVHTTELGAGRISKNLGLSGVDPVAYCIEKIENLNSVITRAGKNWYVENNREIITVNAYNYVIITAHKKK